MRTTDVTDEDVARYSPTSSEVELDEIRRKLVSAATRNKEERFLRSLARHLKAATCSAFLEACADAILDPVEDFESDYDWLEFKKILPGAVRYAFSPGVAAEITTELANLRLVRR